MNPDSESIMGYVINRVVVIGSGTMGGGIAAHVANAGLPVYLLDVTQSIVSASLECEAIVEALNERSRNRPQGSSKMMG